MFWRSFAIDIEFADLAVSVRYGEFHKTGYVLVREWEGLV